MPRITRRVIGRLKGMYLMPTMIELFVVSWKMQIWNTCVGRNEPSPVDQDIARRRSNSFMRNVIRVCEYYFSPVLIVCGISIQIRESNVHGPILFLKKVTTMKIEKLGIRVKLFRQRYRLAIV